LIDLVNFGSEIAIYGRARALIANDEALSALAKACQPCAAGGRPNQNAENCGDPAHDLLHCLRVADWTLAIAESEVDARTCVAAALLHDVVNVPKDAPDRAAASARSAARARDLLVLQGFPEFVVQEITVAIRDHSFSRGAVPETALGRALQDADRLDSLGVFGILRTVSTGTRMGSLYFDSEDPWAKDRELDDRRFMIDHFFRKLLRLPDLMHTELGRREAKRRADFLVLFLRELAGEMGVFEGLAERSS